MTGGETEATGDVGPRSPSTTPRRKRLRKLVLPAVTIAVLVAVFLGVFPRFVDYSQAWVSIRRLPVIYLFALVGAAVVNIAVGAWPLQAALPGLRYRPAFVVGQTSFTLSNAVPAGGAVALAVEYEMLQSYGFDTGAASSATAISSLSNVFATLVMPVVGLLALLGSGMANPRYVLFAITGLVVVGTATTSFALILRSEPGARRVGRATEHLVNSLLRPLRRGQTVDLSGKVLDFRARVIDVIRGRWAAVIGAALLPQFISWAVLLLALFGLQSGGQTNFQVTWSESLAAFSFAVIASFLPVSAGGLGTVDAGITGLLAAFGATASEALAVDLVWRAGTFVPQLLTGAVAFFSWQAATGRRRRRVRQTR